MLIDTAKDRGEGLLVFRAAVFINLKMWKQSSVQLLYLERYILSSFVWKWVYRPVCMNNLESSKFAGLFCVLSFFLTSFIHHL